MAQTPEGAQKILAKKLGLPFPEYMEKVRNGYKYCTNCKIMHLKSDFGKDITRYDGMNASCSKSRNKRLRERYVHRPYKLKGWLVPARDGDKIQARQRVNILVKNGSLPHPNDVACVDCGHIHMETGRRHEYDHYKGYGADYQLVVQVVCSACHHERERRRRDDFK